MAAPISEKDVEKIHAMPGKTYIQHRVWAGGTTIKRQSKERYIDRQTEKEKVRCSPRTKPFPIPDRIPTKNKAFVFGFFS